LTVFDKAPLCSLPIIHVVNSLHYNSRLKIKKWTSKEKEQVFCLWISRDPDEECENYGTENHRQMLASFNSTMNASTGNFQEVSSSVAFNV